MAMGVNTVAGRVTNEPVAEFLGVEFVEPLAAFAG
jgi:alanine dehydrogenase